jgi:hypothetical protein
MTNEKIAVFKVGQTITARSICDYDCIFSIEILSRTKHFVTVKDMYETHKCKITVWGGRETIKPFGSYSMSPIFKALDEAA